MFRVLLLVAVLLLVGWYGFRWLAEPLGLPVSTTISELTRNPGSFDGKVVTVGGKVVDRLSILGASAWRITSPEGETVVIIGLNTAPAPGESVTVHGVFRVAAAIGEFQAPVIVAR